MCRVNYKRNRDAQRTMCQLFSDFADENVYSITDRINLVFINVFNMSIDEIDTIPFMKQSYQTLAYHHSLYKKGSTTIKWFRNICEEEKL